MKKGRKFWEFRAQENNEDVGELLLYGDIGYDGGLSWLFDDITPKKFKEDLDALGDIKTLNVYINSDGGDVFAGQAILSMIKRHKAKVNVYVDGLAASIASVIAMAGDVVYMPRNSMMMVHLPWTIALGNANDFREIADTLDKVRESLVAAYQEKTNLSREEIIELLDAETWMSAEEAVEKGFADEIEESKQVAAALAGKGERLIINNKEFDLGAFKNRPDRLPVVDGVIPQDVSREKAPEDEEWSAPDLNDFTDEAWDDLSSSEQIRIAGHYAWAKEMPPDNFDHLKLPHHRPTDGAVVWRAVANAAARLPQTDIPEDDVSGVQDHIGSHYKQFGRTPPWERDEDSWKEYVRLCKALNNGFESEQAIKWSNLRAKLFPELLPGNKTSKNKNSSKPKSNPEDEKRQRPLSLFERRVQVNEKGNL